MTPEELTARREALGLSGPELAREVGVAESTIWRWENTAKPVRPNAVMARHLERVLARLERRRPRAAPGDGEP